MAEGVVIPVSGLEIDVGAVQQVTVEATIFRAGRCAEHADLQAYPEPVPCERCANTCIGIEPQGVVSCWHRFRWMRRFCGNCRNRSAGLPAGNVRIRGIDL